MVLRFFWRSLRVSIPGGEPGGGEGADEGEHTGDYCGDGGPVDCHFCGSSGRVVGLSWVAGMGGEEVWLSWMSVARRKRMIDRLQARATWT